MRIRIAVIDDGVSQQAAGSLAFEECVDSLKSDIPTPADSHGSIAAAIIRRYARAPVSIGSYKILHSRTHTGNAEDLVRALYWCADHDIDVIHLSLGIVSPQDFAELYRATKFVHSRGGIIVAACKNDSRFALPASSSYSIGVACAPHLTGPAYETAPAPNARIDFLASARHKIRLSPGTRCHTAVCNSNAAPLITALVCNHIGGEGGYTPDSVKLALRKSAGCRERYPCYDSVEPYDRAIVCRIRAGDRHALHERDSLDRLLAESDAEIVGFVFDDQAYRDGDLVKTAAEAAFAQGKSVSFLSHPFPANGSLPVRRLYRPCQLLHYRDRGQRPDVPVLAFTGAGAAGVARRVAHKLQENGYAALLLSDRAEDFLRGFTYLHPAGRSAGAIAELVRFYGYELICAVPDPAIGLPDMEIDIHVPCGEEALGASAIAPECTLHYGGDFDGLFWRMLSLLT